MAGTIKVSCKEHFVWIERKIQNSVLPLALIFIVIHHCDRPRLKFSITEPSVFVAPFCAKVQSLGFIQQNQKLVWNLSTVCSASSVRRLTFFFWQILFWQPPPLFSLTLFVFLFADSVLTFFPVFVDSVSHGNWQLINFCYQVSFFPHQRLKGFGQKNGWNCVEDIFKSLCLSTVSS